MTILLNVFDRAYPKRLLDVDVLELGGVLWILIVVPTTETSRTREVLHRTFFWCNLLGVERLRRLPGVRFVEVALDPLSGCVFH